MKNRMTAKGFVRKYIMEIILVVMVVLLAIFAQGFFTPNNLLGIFRNMTILGVIAFGMTMVIIGGEIDISVGSGIALSAVITALASSKMVEAGMNGTAALIIAMVLAIAVGACIGFFNGWVRTQFNIPSMIITLAMLNVVYGIAAVISKGFPVVITQTWYSFIGAGQIGANGTFQGIPVPAIWLFVVFFIVMIVMEKTRFGREVYAVGGNPEAARLSGINVRRVKIIVMTVVQILAAFAGIILSSQVLAGSSQFGKGYEMDVIAAVVIGGAALTGGIGKVRGTLIGIIFLGVILNGMTLLGVDDFVKYIVRGSLILIAVILNTIQIQGASKDEIKRAEVEMKVEGTK